MKDTLMKLMSKKDLTAAEMGWAMDQIMSGQISEQDIISFLTLLRDKKETVQEITGAVDSLRKMAMKLPCKAKDLMDTCGTGGDSKNTFNISTAAAFVVAGAGITMAKHGNRAVSSQCGSADVLRALGVNVDAPLRVVAQCVDEIGIGFLFAPIYYGALKVVGPARKKIGTRTLFNILGPLLNPAGAKKQVIGVYDAGLLTIVAQVLNELGSESVAVVHGDDGLDELTMVSKSKICFMAGGRIHEEEFDPRTVGYPFCRPEDLRGGTAEENARRLKKMLKGHSEPVDHCVHLNAALAFIVAGKAKDFKDGLLLAQESISSGKAYEKLEALIEMSNSR